MGIHPPGVYAGTILNTGLHISYWGTILGRVGHTPLNLGVVRAHPEPLVRLDSQTSLSLVGWDSQSVGGTVGDNKGSLSC